MTRNFLLILTLFAANPSFSQTSAQLKSQPALTTTTSPQLFSADLKEGFHFNDKAPNNLNIDGREITASDFKARHVQFQLPKKYDNSQATLYVCDDAITFCETHHIAVKGQSSKLSVLHPAKKIGTIDSNGFIEDDLKKALLAAKNKHQLVLIDFAARWCPGCVRYEKEIFRTSEFKKITKNFIKLKIDVDQFENFALSEKYNILGIPTFVVLNADQIEVDRLMDFQTLVQLKPFFETLEKDPTPLSQLMGQQPMSPKTQLEIGKRLYAGGRFSESIAYLEKVTPPPPELLGAQVSHAQEIFAKEATKKKEYTDELRRALKIENDTTRSLSWRVELLSNLDSKSPEDQKIAFDGITLADQWLKNPEVLKGALKYESLGEFTGFEKLLVAQYRADLIEASGATEDLVLKAWLEAARIGQNYHIPASRTGPSLRHLLILSQAHMWQEAQQLSQEILKFDPSNSDIKRRQLKFLLGEKKFLEAQKLGEKLLPTAEGRIQFMIAESLAKAYIGSEKKDSAKSLMTAYLARPEIQSEKMSGTKKSFEGLLKTLQ